MPSLVENEDDLERLYERKIVSVYRFPVEWLYLIYNVCWGRGPIWKPLCMYRASIAMFHVQQWKRITNTSVRTRQWRMLLDICNRWTYKWVAIGESAVQKLCMKRQETNTIQSWVSVCTARGRWKHTQLLYICRGSFLDSNIMHRKLAYASRWSVHVLLGWWLEQASKCTTLHNATRWWNERKHAVEPNTNGSCASVATW